MESFRYRIIFSDLDGTLLRGDHSISARTKEALRSLTSRGIIFVPVSARTPDAIMPIVRDIGIDAPIISYSGALVTLPGGGVVKSTVIEKPLAYAVIDELSRRYPGVVPSFYAGRDWYVTDCANPLVQNERDITGVRPKQADFKDLLSRGILPHKFLCMCEKESCLKIRRALHQRFPALSVVPSSDFLLELMDASVSKSAGIRALLFYLQLRAEDALAFGDSYNDIDMLKAVGTGVAVANACEEVKQAAKAIAPSNDEDGVLSFLTQAGL